MVLADNENNPGSTGVREGLSYNSCTKEADLQVVAAGTRARLDHNNPKKGPKTLVEREHQHELISSRKNWIFLHFLNSLNATEESLTEAPPHIRNVAAAAAG